jgi:anaerobic ribonucleoside-triphosphate reductase
MKLKDARLCIDCDEVYEAEGLSACCPSCKSESFSLITRWLPSVDAFVRWVDGKKKNVTEDASTSPARTT